MEKESRGGECKEMSGDFFPFLKAQKNADVIPLFWESYSYSWKCATEGLNCIQDGQRIPYCDDDDDSDNH